MNRDDLNIHATCTLPCRVPPSALHPPLPSCSSCCHSDYRQFFTLFQYRQDNSAKKGVSLVSQARQAICSPLRLNIIMSWGVRSQSFFHSQRRPPAPHPTPRAIYLMRFAIGSGNSFQRTLHLLLRLQYADEGRLAGPKSIEGCVLTRKLLRLYLRVCTNDLLPGPAPSIGR